LLDPSLISTDFGYPNTLTLQDAAALTGPYTNLSKVGRIANCDYYDGNQLFVEHALSGTVCFFFERRGRLSRHRRGGRRGQRNLDLHPDSAVRKAGPYPPSGAEYDDERTERVGPLDPGRAGAGTGSYNWFHMARITQFSSCVPISAEAARKMACATLLKLDLRGGVELSVIAELRFVAHHLLALADLKNRAQGEQVIFARDAHHPVFE